MNAAEAIFGKTFASHYKLRSLSAGSSRTGSADDGSDHVAQGSPGDFQWYPRTAYLQCRNGVSE